VLGLGTRLAADLAVPTDSNELIAYGPLLSDNGANWLGIAALVRALDPDTARAILPWTGAPASKYTTGSSAGGREHVPRTPRDLCAVVSGCRRRDRGARRDRRPG
jgi:hypothetical protein